MAVKVIMPKQGLQMTEGTILKWLVSEGEKVAADEPLFEIETDKLTIEIDAPASGTLLKILKDEGEEVPIAEIIGVIGKEGEDISSILGDINPQGNSVEGKGEEIEKSSAAITEYSNTADNIQYDLIVIGGGPGGYTAAIYAAKNELKVAIVEKENVGGTCLNRGCIPTKTLIHSASLYNDRKSSGEFGINFDNVTVDWSKVQSNKDNVVNKLRLGVKSLLKGNKVEIYSGSGKLIDKNTVQVGQETITGKDIIIATGSEPTPAPFLDSDLEGVITSNEALEFTDIPSSIVIIGGGVIGMELAYIYSTFGTEVTVIEMLPEVLIREDAEVAAELKKVFRKQGIEILTDTKVTRIEKDGNNLVVNYQSQEKQGKINCEKTVVSIGRQKVLPELGNMDLRTDRAGIIIDDYLRTNIPNIYAIGDVTGKAMLAHAASYQGIKAVENILEHQVKADYSIIPSCIYTYPEIASVGLTEEDAKAKYGSIKIGKFSFAASGRAMSSGENTGFVKIVTDTKWNEILGVHIIGPNATELIAEAALAIKLQCTAEELVDTIHAHPSLAESVMEASLDVLGMAIHKL